MDPIEGGPLGKPGGEPLPRPPTEGDAPPERASLGLLFGAAALALVALLGVVALVAALALKP